MDNCNSMLSPLPAGMDYMPVQMQLLMLFLLGEFEKTISINLVDDIFIEDSQEFFSVSLHSPMSDLRAIIIARCFRINKLRI